MPAANHVILLLLFLALPPCAQALPADTVLPNGIRLLQLPAKPNSFEIIAGYTSGGRSELAAELRSRLYQSASARSLTLAAYGAGGEVEFFDEIDRTGFHLTGPDWAGPLIVERITAWFLEAPAGRRNAPAARNSDFRSRVEKEIRLVLMGPAAAGDDPVELFQQEYGTDRAFVGVSAALMQTVGESLTSVPARMSKPENAARPAALTAERAFTFASDLPAGAVILAVPVPGVFYDQWFSMLLLDRLLQKAIPGNPGTSLHLTIDPYYYRLEIPVPAGQFPEPAQQTLLQEIERLHLSRANAQDLETARRSAVDFLHSSQAVQWFASQGIPERREEGVGVIASLSADDMRVAVRDLLMPNRVVAAWAPAVKRLTIEVEPLAATTGPAGPPPPARQELPGDSSEIPVVPAPFPSHSHALLAPGAAEKLSSGISIVASTIDGVFVAGAGLTKFSVDYDDSMMTGFQNYRADRILVFAPQAAMDRARQLWGRFKGSVADAQDVSPRGPVTPADLPSLVLMKVILDRKLIESGLWNDVKLQFSAESGPGLNVDHPAVKAWISRIAAEGVSEAELRWAQEVAMHHIGDTLPHLQALTWERVPGWIIQDLETVSASQIQQVAMNYF